jgi:histidine triad (HIT) family protein
MTYDPNNIFAKILRKDIPAKIVYEDDYCLAFPDINPKSPIHILVIPKGSYTDLYHFSAEASPQEIEGFFRGLAKVAKQFGLSETGFRSIANTGKDGGQEVPHFHVHLLGGRTQSPF